MENVEQPVQGGNSISKSFEENTLSDRQTSLIPDEAEQPKVQASPEPTIDVANVPVQNDVNLEQETANDHISSSIPDTPVKTEAHPITEPVLNAASQPIPSEIPTPKTSEQDTVTDHLPSIIPAEPVQTKAQPSPQPAIAAEAISPAKKETSKQRRRREAEEQVLREEQEELAEKEFQQYRIDQEKMEMARLEKIAARRRQKDMPVDNPVVAQSLQRTPAEAQSQHDRRALEASELQRRRLMDEADATARAIESTRRKNLVEEVEANARAIKLTQRRKLEEAEAHARAAKMERPKKREEESKRLEEEAVANAKAAELTRQEKLEEEALVVARAAEMAQQKKLKEEAEVRSAAEAAHKTIIQAEAEAEVDRLIAEQRARVRASTEQSMGKEALPSSSSFAIAQPLKSTTSPQHVSVPAGPALTAPLSTSSPQSQPVAPAVASLSVTDPVNLSSSSATFADHQPTHSVTTSASKGIVDAPESAPRISPGQMPGNADHAALDRHRAGSPRMPVPAPQAVSLIIENNRPPAPSPPVTRARPRHAPAFDSEDDSDSALVRRRRQFRGGEDYIRDSSGSTPTHHRSAFASRVPPEQSYPNAPPPQPPGYHPGYYPPTAPPNYQSHNYRVSQQGYPHPSTYGPLPHSSSSPYTEPWNYPPGYRHDSPPQRHDTLVSRDYPLGLAPIDTRSALGDDPGDVFSRIAQAIPDLHVLLARYKETHGQLTVREELLRRTGAEQEEKLRAKDDEIAELKEKARHLEYRYTAEASRLRLEVGNLEEQAKELREQRAETDRYKREAQDIKVQLEATMKSWETRYKELEEAHAKLTRTSAEEKARASQEFDEWKSTYTTRNDAEKIALAIQFDKRLKDADVLAETKSQEAAAVHFKEKEELRSEHQRQQLERQASFDQVRNELETKLSAAQLDREDALKQERESREVWLAEREALIKSHQDERDLLEAQHRKSKEDSEQTWIDFHAETSRKADEETSRADQLMREKDELQKKYNAQRAESEQEKAIIKSVATNLESEKSRLEKLMECYGDIAEIKSKGDTY